MIRRNPLFALYRPALAATLIAFFCPPAACDLGAAETLDRGLVAIRTGESSVYLGWRFLADDPAGRVFNIYRSTAGGAPVKVNETPHVAGTNVVDTNAPLDQPNAWWIRAVALPRGGAPQEGPELGRIELPAATPLRPYLSIKLKDEHTTFQKVALADLDGDGKLDFVIKQPSVGLDPGTPAVSPDTYKLEAYRHDGTFLWRKDLGWNLNLGIWWTPFVVWDFDGDGKAEIAVKTAPFAATREASLAEKDGPARGFVIKGDEYCSILDGMTGEEITRVDWVERGDAHDWGDNRGNRVNRNQIGLAYLDGKTPSLLVCRGTYTRMVVDAYNLKNRKLEKVWRWDGDEESPRIRGQGSHTLKVGDVDGDGRDEIILGSVAIDDHGKALWNLGLGHPDILYLADIIPARPGLEIAFGYEDRQDRNGICLVDARTGEIIWGHPYKTTHIHDQGMIGDFIPGVPGLELYAAEQDGTGKWIYSAATGHLLGEEDLGGLSPRPLWWDETTTKAYIPGRTFGAARGGRGSGATTPAGAGRGADGGVLAGPSTIVRYGARKIGEFEGRLVSIADVVGDWREEIIVSVPGELRIYTTTIPTPRRRPALMQDPLYRKDVALQTMGYLYPAQLSYHFR